MNKHPRRCSARRNAAFFVCAIAVCGTRLACGSSSGKQPPPPNLNYKTLAATCSIAGAMPALDANGKPCAQTDVWSLTNLGHAMHARQCGDMNSTKSWQLSVTAMASVRSQINGVDIFSADSSYPCNEGTTCETDVGTRTVQFTLDGNEKIISVSGGEINTPTFLRPALDAVCTLPEQP